MNLATELSPITRNKIKAGRRDFLNVDLMVYFGITHFVMGYVVFGFLRVICTNVSTLQEIDCGLPTDREVCTFVFAMKSSICHVVNSFVDVFCRPDQFSRSRYVDDNSCLLVSSLPSLFYTMTSHRDIYTYEMLRNYSTVPSRCRHRGGMVDPLCYTACSPPPADSPSNQILDHSVQNHPKTSQFSVMFCRPDQCSLYE
jgi:hypothetical protein